MFPLIACYLDMVFVFVAAGFVQPEDFGEEGAAIPGDASPQETGRAEQGWCTDPPRYQNSN